MDSGELLDRVVSETGLDKEEIEEEVEDKMEEFSGMVSEEGAIHLVAKEHDVKITGAKDKELKVENIVPGMRKVNIKARVTNILDPNTFERDSGEEGQVQNVILADDTGSIRLTLWDEQTEIAEKVGEGDTIEIVGAYSVEDNRGNAELRLGDESQVKMADEDDVPEVETGGEDTTTTEATVREVDSENASYRIKGMLMAVYTSNPFYRVDPETGATVSETEDGDYVTKDGKEVEEPENRLAVSGVIDDGTGNIRCVFFRDQARDLLDIDEEVVEEGDIDVIEDAAEDIIGTELEIEGRARYNDYFGRLEMIVNEKKQVGPDEELEEILELMEA